MKVIRCEMYKDQKRSVLSGGDFLPTYTEGNRLNIFPVEKQSILGFGGAFTNSAAYVYAQMTPEQKEESLEALFGESGLRYNFCRLCLGSSDFSPYDYLNVEEGDETLDTFNIDEDRKYIIPFVKDAIKKAKEEIFLFASPWSPPAFMKENGSRYNGGKLKREYYGLWAEYMVRFVEEYAKEGIKISALTIQNEPNARQTWESCYYTAKEELEFLLVLSDTIQKHGLDTKILCWDHNKEGVYDRASAIYPTAGDKVWGLGFHWYSGEHYDALEMHRSLYPHKALVATEFCRGLNKPASWDFRKEWLHDIRCGANAICEWNLILDENGGPFHHRNGGCTSPVSFNRENGVIKEDLWGIEYMFAHFIKRGAKALYTSTFEAEAAIAAVRNPDGNIIACISNNTTNDYDAVLNYNSLEYRFKLPAKAMITMELSE